MSVKGRVAAPIIAVTLASTATIGTATPAHAVSLPTDYIGYKCKTLHQEDACVQLIEMNNYKVSKDFYRCLALAGVAVATITIGEGIPVALTSSVARKYIAGAAGGCIGAYI